MKTKHFFAVAFFVACLCCGPIIAQDDENPVAGQPAEKENKPSKLIAITGGDVYTVTGAVIRGGTVLIEDDKILEVGQAVTVPEGAEVIDATGKVVAPGFVAISMSGIAVRGAPAQNAQLADSLDPYDRNIKYALGVGITTGCVQLSAGGRGGRRGRNEGREERFLGLEPDPQELLTQTEIDFGPEDTALCPCCGLPILPTEPITPAPPTEAAPQKHAVLKMSYGELEPMLVKEDAFYGLAPGALAGALARHQWRQSIKATREALANQRSNASRQGRGDASGAQPGRGSARGGGRGGSRGGGGTRGNEELQRLVRKETTLRASANTIDEIRDMIDLAQELDYNLVIEGAVEGWLAAKELGEAKVPVIFTPRRRRDPQPGAETTSGSSIESTGIFERSGIPFATAALGSSVSLGGIAGRDLTSLPLEAAFAVRGGADNETALKSLTIVPAQMLGLQDRIGSIEVGKDADLLILNGPPLDYRTYVETAIVAGKVSYERAVDRVYPVYPSR